MTTYRWRGAVQMTTKPTPFSVGRRWRCHRDPRYIRMRFWFVIVGPGKNYSGVPSKAYKRCRIDVHPDDIANRVRGYDSHGSESDYSHAHLRRCAYLEDL